MLFLCCCISSASVYKHKITIIYNCFGCTHVQTVKKRFVGVLYVCVLISFKPFRCFALFSPIYECSNRQTQQKKLTMSRDTPYAPTHPQCVCTYAFPNHTIVFLATEAASMSTFHRIFPYKRVRTDKFMRESLSFLYTSISQFIISSERVMYLTRGHM